MPRTQAHRSPVGLFLLICIGLLASCSSTKVAARVLPFHVAVLPFEALESTAQREIEGTPVGFELLLDGALLAREVASQLDGFAFTRVSTLEYPAGVGPVEFHQLPASQRAAWWREAAEVSQADLVLSGQVRYDPTVHSKFAGSATWAVLAQTLRVSLGGFALRQGLDGLLAVLVGLEVSEWWNEDRVYLVEVGLECTLHELSVLGDDGAGASLVNRQARLAGAAAFRDQVKLRFHQRASRLDYPLSLIIPTPLLGGDLEKEHRSLRQTLASELLGDWVRQLGLREAELLEGGGVLPYGVDALRLERRATWTLVGQVRLDTRVLDLMDGLRVRVDGRDPLEVPLGEGPVPGVFSFEVPLPEASDGSTVRLEIRDGALRQGVRNFSLIAGLTGTRVERAIRMELPAPPSQLDPLP